MKLVKSFFVSLLLLASAALNAQTYQNGLIDKTIAVVGNEAILLSQLEAEVQMMLAQGVISTQNVRCEILENLLKQKLFLIQAKLDSLKVNEDNVEMELQDRMNNALTALGGEKELAQYFNKPVHKLRAEWRETLRETSLTQQMQQKVVSDAGSLTPSQVERFYRKVNKDSLPIISTMYQLSQIVLYPSKEAAGLVAKERLLEFRNRILNGERFSTLATIYSQDPGSASRGGELRMAPKSLYWPAFSDAAMALKPGQISQVVETPDGFHIIQMIERNGDMFNARHILIKPEYTSVDRNKAFKTLDSLKTLILADSITFDRAAFKHSFEGKSAMNHGIMIDENTGASYFEKDQLKPADYNAVKNLKEGEISEPFESLDNEGRGNVIYKIIRLEKILPSHVANIKDDFMVVQNVANGDLAQKAIDKFIAEKQVENYIYVDDLFKNCQFSSKGWIK
ncbi:MAG: peptidylprolyl isomerase [Bacteroidales bacterium]|nr:peptidylprolyl isomerase [Candidatus Egerieousia equi]MCQ2118015.1 peptidylprolyl isomerase [Bacteroidales bacterium]